MSAIPPSGQHDPVLETLDRLVTVLDDTCRQAALAGEQAVSLRRLRVEGRPMQEIIRDEPRPLVVEIVTDCLSRLAEAGSAFRRSVATALHEEGLTMEEIAQLFGVSRQRVSRLLRPGSG